MNYYSTNNKANTVSLKDAVIKGLASDKGLYMPEVINKLPQSFFENITNMTFDEISKVVASSFFGDDISKDELDFIVTDTLNFDIPIVKVDHNIYALELFHGPTLAFKDVGARFMARMLSHFVKEEPRDIINVLVATSGDTGSAVANGFLGVEGIRVFVLYPAGRVSDIQEAQFTTLGQNITAIEVDGTFDDCQALVKFAFMDAELNSKMKLTSANSINVARFLPQSFYYFYAYAQLARLGLTDKVVVSVPSGNLGNLTAGMFAKYMGLPIDRFIAANNMNDVFYNYLQSGEYNPKTSVQTVANAMDVGDPSNFVRILDLYEQSHDNVIDDLSGYAYSDEAIREVINEVYHNKGYLLDPHGACAYMAARESLKEGETALFLATAHPAKFKDIVEECIEEPIELPGKLASFMKDVKVTEKLAANYSDFKNLLLKSI